MNDIVEKIYGMEEKAKKILEQIEENTDFEVAYTAIHKKSINESYVYIVSTVDDSAWQVRPYKEGTIKDKVVSLPDWSVCPSEDMFFDIEKNYRLETVNMSTHLMIWRDIFEKYPDDIIYKKGMQQYMKYCKENKITKEVIEKETGAKNANDIMPIYEEIRKNKKKTRGEI